LDSLVAPPLSRPRQLALEDSLVTLSTHPKPTHPAPAPLPANPPALQLALEDSLVTMSTILASRFVAGIRSDVEKVERQLSLFAETLDQWVQVIA
jgi:hypothetical protein